MNRHQNGGGRGIQILHFNLRRSFLSLQIVTDDARSHDIDVLLLPDIPSSLMNQHDSFWSFQKFLSVGQGTSGLRLCWWRTGFQHGIWVFHLHV